MFKSICDLSLLVIQDSTSTERRKSNNIHKINRKGTNSTNKSEQNTTTNKSNPNSVSTNKSAIIIGSSVVKHLTDPRISKTNHVKIKTNPGTKTEDIIDYIKLSIWQKPGFLLVHSETNYLTNGINTMIIIRKVIATVREMDNERTIMLGFTSVIGQDDVDKSDKIVVVNDRL